jgi:hypothetical protein
MSKEVVVQSWCDGDHEERVAATVEREETLGGEPYLLDLCGVCDLAFAEALGRVRVWLERGVPRSQAEAPPPRRVRHTTGQPSARPEFNTVQMRTCPEQGCVDPRTNEHYIAPTRTALGQHLKTKHGTRLGNYDWPT